MKFMIYETILCSHVLQYWVILDTCFPHVIRHNDIMSSLTMHGQLSSDCMPELSFGKKSQFTEINVPYVKSRVDDAVNTQ
jgi:hypothetical protein